MTEVLSIAASITTVISLIAFLAGLAFWAYRRRLGHDLAVLQSLPENRRLPFLDDTLGKYGLSLKDDLPAADRVKLALEEMVLKDRTKWRQFMLSVVTGSLVLVTGMVLAAVSIMSPSDPDTDRPKNQQSPTTTPTRQQEIIATVWQVRMGKPHQQIEFDKPIACTLTTSMDICLEQLANSLRQALWEKYVLGDSSPKVDVRIPPKVPTATAQIIPSGLKELYSIECWYPDPLTGKSGPYLYKHFPFNGFGDVQEFITARKLDHFFIHIERTGYDILTRRVDIGFGLEREFKLTESPVYIVLEQDQTGAQANLASSFGQLMARSGKPEWKGRFMIRSKTLLDKVSELYEKAQPAEKGVLTRALPATHSEKWHPTSENGVTSSHFRSGCHEASMQLSRQVCQPHFLDAVLF